MKQNWKERDFFQKAAKTHLKISFRREEANSYSTPPIPPSCRPVNLRRRQFPPADLAARSNRSLIFLTLRHATTDQQQERRHKRRGFRLMANFSTQGAPLQNETVRSCVLHQNL